MERITGGCGENTFDLIARAARLQVRAEVVHNGEVIEVPADLPWLAAVQWLHDALVHQLGQLRWKVEMEAQELRAEVAALKAEVESLRERR